MPQYVLENEQLTARFKAEGAELISVQDKLTNQEYIWQADPTVWARHAPVLFPIVGRLKNDEYQLDGETYHLTQHGFARDQDFSVIEQSKEKISFGLTATPETRELYPFNFVLNIRYTLSERNLQVTYQVTNQDQSDMPFSIGGHPAFYCPAQQDHRLEEYHLLFEKKESLDRYYLEDGLRTGTSERLLDDNNTMPLHRKLFEADAVIFKNPVSDWVSLVRQSDGQKIVTVYCDEFPYLGVWQKVGADFYCIEPWCGLADAEDSSGDFTEKEGIQKLTPDQQFTAQYQIKFH